MVRKIKKTFSFKRGKYFLLNNPRFEVINLDQFVIVFFLKRANAACNRETS